MGVFASRSHRELKLANVRIQNKRLQEIANGIF